MSIAEAREVVTRAIAGGVFPAAAIDVGSSERSLWREAFGALTFDEDALRATADTLFDLASLTKPIATTTAVLSLVGAGRLGLDDLLSTRFPEWRGDDRTSVTVRDLLEHASGLAARLPDPCRGERREFEHEICRMPLEYSPRTRSLYSDLGFILLGFVVADVSVSALDRVFADVMTRLTGQAAGLSAPHLQFNPPPHARVHAAPTQPMADDRRRGRLLVGEVHDDYAAALGGVAGHAGLFGTATSTGAFAQSMLRAARGAVLAAPFTPDLVRLATARSTVPGSSRALGWDTMLTTSSCGSRMSRSAFGHVGFTGTSMWVDPLRDRYFVLLTNRACGGGTLDQMRQLRREFHDALGDV